MAQDLRALGVGLPAPARPWGAEVRARAVRILPRLGRGAFVLGLGLLVLAPLVRLQALALEDGAAAYDTAAQVHRLGSVVATTLALALGSLLFALVVGTLLAWLASQLPRRMQWLSVVPVLPIVIPAVANVTGWSFLFAPRAGYVNSFLRSTSVFSGLEGPFDIFTVPWIVIVTGFGLTSFVYLFVRSGLRNLDYELVEAARASGARPSRVLFDVVLPLLRPVIVYGGGVALLLGLGQFTAPLLLGTANNVRVITTEMYKWVSEPPTDYAVAAAVGSPLLVAGLAVVALQRRMLRHGSRYVTHGGKAFRSVGRPLRWAALPILGYGVIGIVLPLLALAVVALSPYYSGDIDVGRFTLANFEAVFDNPLTVDAIRTSVFASVGGVLVALPLGYVVAGIIYHRRSPALARILDFVVNLPLGVPAVVFGAGFLFAYSRPPFVLYGTDWILLAVYVTLMLPYATRMILGARLSLGDRYLDASRTSGAGPLRTQLEILLPLLRTSLAGAAALMVVLLTHEFAASLLVRSGTTEVMGTRLYDLWSLGSYPVVAAMALVMCGITATGLCLALAFSRGSNVLDRL